MRSKDGEGEDADHVQQPYSKNSFHGAAAGRGREKAMGLPVSGCTKRRPQLCRAMLPFWRLPYFPSPYSGCLRLANCTRI